MSTSNFETRLLDVDLSNVTVERDTLVSDAIMLRKSDLEAIFRGLPQETMTAEELLRNFDDTGPYRMLTSGISPAAIVILQQSVRQFVIESIFQEAAANHFSGDTLDLAEEQGLEIRVRLLVKDLMRDKRAELLRKAHVINPETVTISVRRVASALRSSALNRVQEQKTELETLEQQKADPKDIELAKVMVEFAEREVILAEVVRQMADEVPGKTDLRFFAQEVKARLEAAVPADAEDLTEYFRIMLEDFAGDDMARQDPELKLYQVGQDEREELIGAWRGLVGEALQKVLYSD